MDEEVVTNSTKEIQEEEKLKIRSGPTVKYNIFALLQRT
jgi:hypothetical protein